jgi:hypothetical protein
MSHGSAYPAVTTVVARRLKPRRHHRVVRREMERAVLVVGVCDPALQLSVRATLRKFGPIASLSLLSSEHGLLLCVFVEKTAAAALWQQGAALSVYGHATPFELVRPASRSVTQYFWKAPDRTLVSVGALVVSDDDADVAAMTREEVEKELVAACRRTAALLARAKKLVRAGDDWYKELCALAASPNLPSGDA